MTDDEIKAIKTKWNIPVTLPMSVPWGKDDVVWLVQEVERLRAEAKRADEEATALAKIAQGIEEKVGRYLEYHGPSCDEHEDDPDDFCATCRMDTAANDAISELKFWSRT